MTSQPTVRVLVAELINEPLDWAVAEAVGLTQPMHGEPPRVILETRYDPPAPVLNPRPDMYYEARFRPSQGWQDGGPLIEQHITKIEDYGDCWGAEGPDAPECLGPTPLIAAMRALVASKLGPEIDLPADLCAPTSEGGQ